MTLMLAGICFGLGIWCTFCEDTWPALAANVAGWLWFVGTP